MAFDFNTLSKSPITNPLTVTKSNTQQTSSGFNFNALPPSPIEMVASELYQYGSIKPEDFGLSPIKQDTAKWGIGIGQEKQPKMDVAETTPSVPQQLPEKKSYFEGLSDTVDAILESERANQEKYSQGEIGGITKTAKELENYTTLAVAPITEFLNQIPVVNDVMRVMGEGITYGPKGAGEALANVPGYKQILENNPWISDYSEAVTPTVESATITALNLAVLFGTVENAAKVVTGGKDALQYRTKADTKGNLVTRDSYGDIVYIEDKAGVPISGEKPANYPLIRINSTLQNIRESSLKATEKGRVTKNAGVIKEIITGTKSGQNWWAQNAEAEAASSRVAAKVDLSTSIDTKGTVNTKPQQEYFRDTYLDKTETVGYDLLKKEDASVSVDAIIKKLEEEFSGTTLPRSIISKGISDIVKKLSETVDELGNIKLLEVAKEKSAAQRSANFERTRNNSNNEIRNKTVARALRLVVEDVSKTDVAKVNGELAKLYQELSILEKLDGMKVAGGKLGRYFSQISGNIVGGLLGNAIGGPVGGAAAAIAGGEFASALRGRMMAGKFKEVVPSEKISDTLLKAKKDAVDLTKPSPKISTPKNAPKTKEIVAIEDKIAKNVEAQKVAIKEGNFELVAELKKAYDALVEQLKKSIKYLNDNASVGLAIKSSVSPWKVAKKLSPEDAALINDYIVGNDFKNFEKMQKLMDQIGIGKAKPDVQMRFLKETMQEYIDLPDTSIR